MSRASFDYSSQTIVVTGGTRGIGRAISRRFLDAGATVVATYTANRDAADEFKTSAGPAADRLHLRKFEVEDYAQAKAFYAYLEKEHKHFTVLVNNSGIRRDSVLAMMPLDDWQKVLDVNLTGAFNMSKLAVLMFMANRYGRIITITSPSGRFGFEGQANYAASKAGLVAMTRSLSKEVASRGITVNCVSPGLIDTDFIADLPDKLRKEYLAAIPLKRFGTPDEVAASVLFLASRDADYITGSVLSVDGGM